MATRFHWRAEVLTDGSLPQSITPAARVVRGCRRRRSGQTATYTLAALPLDMISPASWFTAAGVMAAATRSVHYFILPCQPQHVYSIKRSQQQSLLPGSVHRRSVSPHLFDGGPLADKCGCDEVRLYDRLRRMGGRGTEKSACLELHPRLSHRSQSIRQEHPVGISSIGSGGTPMAATRG